jgi:hypothetical protein
MRQKPGCGSHKPVKALEPTFRGSSNIDRHAVGALPWSASEPACAPRAHLVWRNHALHLYAPYCARETQGRLQGLFVHSFHASRNFPVLSRLDILIWGDFLSGLRLDFNQT